MAAPQGAPQPAGAGAMAAAVMQVTAPAAVSVMVQAAEPAGAWTMGLPVKPPIREKVLAGV